ncbi:hypothetical protein NQ315_016694 [Exocentrus adspersus]|uniref:Uncharacterized protein n=1 Tax=Exocentrus adspersus TaxID=1586481 RepID=A0AAV8VF41_9CUCU|nr:hypothetical protein NQ315_016694 [Exocentrus adspersus]
MGSCLSEILPTDVANRLAMFAPFTEACTIASGVINSLGPNTRSISYLGAAIDGVVTNLRSPSNGWCGRSNAALTSCVLLKKQEAQVAGFKVDGYSAETKQVFKFHSYYYHGCPTCFRMDRANPIRDDPITNVKHPIRDHPTQNREAPAAHDP